MLLYSLAGGSKGASDIGDTGMITVSATSGWKWEAAQ